MKVVSVRDLTTGADLMQYDEIADQRLVRAHQMLTQALVSPQMRSTQPVQRLKEERDMSETKKTSLTLTSAATTAKTEATEAGKRVLVEEAWAVTRAGVLALLLKAVPENQAATVRLYLDNPLGDLLLRMMVSGALEQLPTTDPRLQFFARELRVQGYADTMRMVLLPLKSTLLQAVEVLTPILGASEPPDGSV